MSGIFRRPAAYMVVNGTNIPVVSCDVHQAKSKKVDTFKAVVPFAALPAGMNEVWFSTAPDIKAQIVLNGTILFDGVVDHTDYDFNGQMLNISGRDKGSALVDTLASEKFQNMTPGDIVRKYAGDHGLQTNIDDVSDKSGKQYQVDWAKIAHRSSKWTVINELADHFGMSAYITGGTVYFKKIDEDLPRYQIAYTKPTRSDYATGNFIRLGCSRNHVLGRPVKTVVQSHSHKKKEVVSANETKGGVGTPLEYRYVIPGLSQAEAQRYATKKHAENIQHELTLTSLEIPGDETLSPLFIISLSGTGTAFDQEYEITGLDHHIGADDGYRTSIGCKNKKKGKQ